MSCISLQRVTTVNHQTPGGTEASDKTVVPPVRTSTSPAWTDPNQLTQPNKYLHKRKLCIWGIIPPYMLGKHVDNLSKFLFPGIFTLFALLYYTKYK